jgi:23S rRNA (adenine2503-C2)-methyltransferase
LKAAISFEAVVTRYDVDRDTLAAGLGGEASYRVAQVWDGLYRRNVDIEAMTDLPLALRSQLAATLPPALSLAREQVSDGGATVKLLLRLADGRAIETVLMHYPARTTVCVSTQAGCAMACGFCATGQAGFDRHLTTGEIVEQIVWARRRAAPRRVSNVVFMGMGEPLANYDSVWAAVERLHRAMGVSARHLTLSTVGIVPGIRRLAGERLPVGLAVSLHAANDGLRDRLVPVNRRYPLASLRGACEDYLRTKSRRLSFEWALIDGVNDRPAHAAELAAYARPLRAHVNLIPLNPTPGYATRGTPPAGVRAFRDRVRELGVNVTVRRNRGTDLDAACGQLAGQVNAPARLSARRP